MFHRLLSPFKSNSFFLFGPRGTGKTTFLKEFFAEEKTFWIDLLDPAVEDRYCRSPETLTQELKALDKQVKWVVIDEVQKVPKLLDLVHFHIENSGIKFALTGSSARKLKKGSANLLAGRAFVNHMFPLTHQEMGGRFDLNDALQWGTLPKTTQLGTMGEKSAFLKAYALTYLKEEVWNEHLVRRLDPFRKFLEIAAQTNGQIINYSNIAKDVGVDTKTAQSYFEILEDTLLGVMLEPFHQSIRKRQRKNPKFYLFDPGVKRALEGSLTQSLTPGSYVFGRAFEHYVILEAHRLNDYHQKDFRFSYMRTKDDAEIDLVVERPGKPLALVEIKSADRIDERATRGIEAFAKDLKKAEAFCLSRDVIAKKIGRVTALPWDCGLKALGL
ncbi:MAG: ATP-binding protein [Elusimicrobia bacterium]|nr:ATP-binding protein [Elusimicrobiota bacterium]